MFQDSQFIKIFKTELRRKALHLLTFLVPGIALYSKPLVLISLGFIVVGYLVLEITLARNVRPATFYDEFLLLFKRGSHFDFAPVYLALGLMVCLFIAQANQVFYATYIVAVCDSAAALIGRRFGRHPIKNLNKSIEGTLAFFIFCLMGSAYFLPLPAAIAATVILTVVELFLSRGLDNFVLPILAQILLKALTGH